MSAAKKLMSVFEGSQKGHGQTTVGRIGRNGKADAKSFVIRGSLTEDIIQGHIDGVQGIGAIPIKSGDVCKFGALDIDVYDLDHKSLSKKIQQLKLPLHHCRSKSGGAHLFLFLKDWEPAVLVREILSEMASAIGFSGCEVFPKQDTIIEDRGDLGNFINLPYFNAEETMRYCFDKKCEAVDLATFLMNVEKNKVSMSELNEMSFAGDRKHFGDGAYCLELISSLGKVTENRNIFLFAVGVYCRKKWTDDWKKHHEEYNRLLCQPPLPASEVMQLQKSLEKKDYFYQCDICPLKDHCNKEICKTRKYGIGNDGADAPRVDALTIMQSEPRLYFLTVDGGRLVLSTDQLQHPSLFQKACMEQLDIMPPVPKPGDWQKLINSMMETATKLSVSEELTYAGQFKNHLRDYCTSRIRAMAPEEIEMGKPWTERGTTMFRIEALMEYLKNRGFTQYTRAQVQDQLKHLNHDQECHGTKNIRREDGRRTSIRVWWVPEFEDMSVEITAEEKSDEIPF
jgi:hypothetical protein|tara:strand:+ start:933 stop:2465 length:1533 start_codon:yes stop_codon:yes gene_type:complete